MGARCSGLCWRSLFPARTSAAARLIAGLNSRRRSSQYLLATAAVLTCLSASAQTALPYESDFESPDFTPGLLQSDPEWAFDPLTLSVEAAAA